MLKENAPSFFIINSSLRCLVLGSINIKDSFERRAKASQCSSGTSQLPTQIFVILTTQLQ